MRQIGDALASSVTGEGLQNAGAVRFSADAAVAQMRIRMAGYGFSPAAMNAAEGAAIDAIRLAYPRCESPIERTFLPALVCADYGEHLEPARVHLALSDPLPDAPIVLVPQLRVLNYRLDFALLARTMRGPVCFAVECDGESHHSRRTDMWRDRVLSSWGWTTVRLRGSEIAEDANSAARKVSAAFFRRMDVQEVAS